MNSSAGWTWRRRQGPAEKLHAVVVPDAPERTVHEMMLQRPALVLGSSQPESTIDGDAARAAGIDVVRRRSGGGAVLLVPGGHVWLDVWLPAEDPLWLDDVVRAGDWLARVWMSAFITLGLDDLAAHTGPVEQREWSAEVCFAGLGPGEVTTTGRKLLGVSQRRTREWARFQCLVHRRWDAVTTFGLLADPAAVDAAAGWVERVAEIGDAPIEAAFKTALDRLT